MPAEWPPVQEKNKQGGKIKEHNFVVWGDQGKLKMHIKTSMKTTSS
jgi:hypothetical protein